MIEEIEAKPWHAGQLARTLRTEHRGILDRMHVATHRELRDALSSSIMTRAWRIDGRLAALAGLRATMASPEGVLWLAMSEEAVRHPIVVGRRAVRFIDQLARTRTRLTTTVLEDDAAGVQFAIFLGFLTDGRSTINGVAVRHMHCTLRKAA